MSQAVLDVTRHCPPEILLRIFKAYVASKVTASFTSSPRNIAPLTGVCRLWRHLITNTPSFWCHITFVAGQGHIDSYEKLIFLQTILERSKYHDLLVQLTIYEPCKEYAARDFGPDLTFITLLLEQSNRFSVLCLDYTTGFPPSTIFAQVLNSRKGHFLTLQCLQLGVHFSNRAVIPLSPDLFGEAPSLRTLGLRDPHAPTIVFPWSQITHFATSNAAYVTRCISRGAQLQSVVMIDLGIGELLQLGQTKERRLVLRPVSSSELGAALIRSNRFDIVEQGSVYSLDPTSTYSNFLTNDMGPVIAHNDHLTSLSLRFSSRGLTFPSRSVWRAFLVGAAQALTTFRLIFDVYNHRESRISSALRGLLFIERDGRYLVPLPNLDNLAIDLHCTIDRYSDEGPSPLQDLYEPADFLLRDRTSPELCSQVGARRLTALTIHESDDPSMSQFMYGDGEELLDGLCLMKTLKKRHPEVSLHINNQPFDLEEFEGWEDGDDDDGDEDETEDEGAEEWDVEEGWEDEVEWENDGEVVDREEGKERDLD